MATENDLNNKTTTAEEPATSAEAKATETEKSAASSASASDKLNDAASSAKAMAGKVFGKAKDLADEAIKTAKSDGTKENLNNAAKTAGALAGKVFAKAKDAAADVKKELGNVNDLRKESFANSEAGTSKKDMAKGFWAKLSGKQKGLLAGILAICVYFSYSVLFSDSDEQAENAAACSFNYGTFGLLQRELGQYSFADYNLKQFAAIDDKWKGNAKYIERRKYLDNLVSTAGSVENKSRVITKAGTLCSSLGLPSAKLKM